MFRKLNDVSRVRAAKFLPTKLTHRGRKRLINLNLFKNRVLEEGTARNVGSQFITQVKIPQI